MPNQSNCLFPPLLHHSTPVKQRISGILPSLRLFLSILLLALLSTVAGKIDTLNPFSTDQSTCQQEHAAYEENGQ